MSQLAAVIALMRRALIDEDLADRLYELSDEEIVAEALAVQEELEAR